MVVKHLSAVRVSGSPLGYLLGNYTRWSDSASCVLGADCTSLRLLVNTNPLPHSSNCEWQSILWEVVLQKPKTGFALDFVNGQSGPWGIRREVESDGADYHQKGGVYCGERYNSYNLLTGILISKNNELNFGWPSWWKVQRSGWVIARLGHPYGAKKV